MKFARLALIAFIGLVCAMFGACKSLPTLQQQFEQACTIVNADLQTLGTSPLVSAADQQTLMQKVLPANQKICSAGAQLNVSDLKAFHDSLLPVAVAIVQSTPALPDQTFILLALNTFGPLVQQQVDMLLSALQTNPASAPVAASTPLSAAPIK